MSTDLAYQFNLGRNGTSQAERLLEALDKDFVQLDERSLKDMLRFAQQYAKELVFVNEQNQPEGDWRGFIGEGEAVLDQITAYLSNPQDFLDDEEALLFLARPQLVLFLSFLKLLQDYSQQALNTFTEKHLDHYFREILGFVPKPPEADHAHVIVNLAKGFTGDKLFLPAQTELSAGEDTAGNPLIYRTQNDLMINRAKVAQLKTLFVNKTVEKLSSYDFTRGFMEMLSLALGESISPSAGTAVLSPGGELPDATFLNHLGPPEENFLKGELASFLRFVGTYLKMSFASFRKLMRLRQNRLHDLNEWASINDYLNQMAATFMPPLTPAFTDPKDFITNFTDATGINPTNTAFFSTLQSVNNVYELYDELEAVLQTLAGNPTVNLVFYQNRRDDLIGFIHEHFYNDPGNSLQDASIDAFRDMMQLRVQIQAEWGEMIEILEQAVSFSFPSFDLESPDFEELVWKSYNLSDAADALAFFNMAHPHVDDADQYHQQMLEIEQYFGLHAEEVKQVVEGKDVVSLLEKAHIQKPGYGRRAQLKEIRLQNYTTSGLVSDLETGFEDIFLAIYGDPFPGIPGGYVSVFDFYIQEVQNEVDENLAEPVRNFIEQTLALSLSHFRFLLETQLDEISSPDHKAPPWKWERVYTLLQKAETQLNPVKSQAPSLSYLEGVHASGDATAIQVADSEDSLNRWETFGNESMPQADMGIVMSSPLLRLAEGERVITMDLHLDTDSLIEEEEALLADISTEALWPFSLSLSGEKDWIPVDFSATYPTDADGDGNTEHVIRFVISLGKEVEPIMQLPTDHADYIGSDPSLKLELNNPAAYNDFNTDAPSMYRLFSDVSFTNVRLSVAVKGLMPSVLRNDRVILKLGEPFEPFGSRPRKGAKFSFTHPEITTKKLDEIDLNIEWMGLPDFGYTYLNYRTARTNQLDFSAFLRMHDKGISRKFLEEGSGTSRTEKSISLFSSTTDRYKLNLNDPLPFTPSPGEVAPPDYQWNEAAKIKDNILGSDRYFYLQLGDLDFGHDEYPGLAARLAKGLAIDLADRNKTLTSQGNLSEYRAEPPYTPQIQSFSINYVATEERVIEEDGEISADGKFQLYHVHPFGYKEAAKKGDYLVARYGNEGELYIGLTDIQPPIDVSFLFQMAEGSADPDLPAPRPLWDYLKGNEWKRLEEKGKLISDTTNGLLNSGIIRIRIPAEADTEHTVLPHGLYWIRVVAPTDSRALSNMIAIHTQAVRVTLDAEGVDDAHFQKPLLPETITQLKKLDVNIQGIFQPYESFGGRPAEAADHLNLRVSERLRHKNRAITFWDYERLVLEKFPQVYRAKCLPGGSKENLQIGKLDMIVVPDIRGLELFDPFEPKLSFNVLEEITAFLQQLAPPAVDITIKNPVYIQLKIRMTVELHPQYQLDNQYYIGELHQGLLKLLAPWAYDEGAELVVGGKFFPSLIINFVEQQFYVDYIKGFQLLFGEEGNLRPASDTQLQNGLQIPRPDGIWVSAKEHLLDAGGDVGRGIGYLKVELDLIVG